MRSHCDESLRDGVRTRLFRILPALWLAGAAQIAGAADVPVDVVIAVDSSGSMDAEVAEFATTINGFIPALRSRGYDPRVILLAESAICVPAPLGAGACTPDDNLPGYRHIAQAVDSNNALQLLVQYVPQFQASLRAGAQRWIVVVTDDNSDIPASQFTSGLLAADASFAGFVFSAIAASAPPFLVGSPCFAISADEGAIYKQLALQTGGAFYDLCLQDFDPAWPRIAGVVIQFRDGFEG